MIRIGTIRPCTSRQCVIPEAARRAFAVCGSQLLLCLVLLGSFVGTGMGQEHPAPTPATTPAAPPVAAAPATPEQMPPLPPEVTYAGGKLTIISKNSTLADILAAVRTLTGAEIDLLASTADERVAAQIGPGPARDVLSSLLSSTDFDYVIQSSAADRQGILSVFLTPRGKEAQAIVLAGSRPAGVQGGSVPVVEASENPEAVKPSGATAAEKQSLATASQAPTSPAESVTQSDTTADGSHGDSQTVAASDDSSLTPSAPPETTLASERPVQPSIYPPPWVAQQEKIEPQIGSPEQMAQQLQHMYQQRLQMQAPKPADPNQH